MNQSQLDSIYEGFHDDETFARESLSVLDKQGHLVPMIYGPAQKKMAALIAKMRERKRPVRIIAEKARQVWISNYIASRFWRDTTHRSGQHTLVIAQDLDTAENVFKYYERFHKHYRPFGGFIQVPERTNPNSSQELDYANESWIHFQTANNLNIGRSHVLRRIHFSEFAFYGDKAKTLMAAAMGAVPEDADTEVIIESTCNGVGNEFHSMCQAAWSGESDWEFFFFAWWEHPEYVRALEGNRGSFQGSLDEEERRQQVLYTLTLEQLNWRRWKIRTDFSGDVGFFNQEFPHSPEVGFLSSGRPRFHQLSINRMPVVRDGLEGGLEMHEVGGSKKLVFLPRELGELVIYRKPQENRDYMVGADASEGIDVNEGRGSPNPDFACAPVLDRDTGEQVARLRARLTPAEFGWQLYLLLIYYNWAQLVPEANGPGLATIDALLRHKYPTDLIYHRIRTPDQDPSERADLIGFKTTIVTRPQMLSLLDDSIRNLVVLIHNPNTLQELRTFVIKANGKAEHQYGCHDDEVIGMGLAVVGMDQMPRKKVVPLRPQSHTRMNNYRTRHDPEDERGERLKLL